MKWYVFVVICVVNTKTANAIFATVKNLKMPKLKVKLAHPEIIRTYAEIQAAGENELPNDPTRIVSEVLVDFAQVFRALRDSMPSGIAWGHGLGYNEPIFLSTRNITALQDAYVKWLDQLVLRITAIETALSETKPDHDPDPLALQEIMDDGGLSEVFRAGYMAAVVDLHEKITEKI